MRRLALSAMFIATALAGSWAIADDRGDDRDNDKQVIAVFGDWPYGPVLFNNANLLIDSINKDPDVSLALHVGDIHSGSQVCTSSGILPVLAKALPEYNQAVYGFFQRIKVPFVYTPGDNEWTDCHKTKQGASGDPLKELAAVRNLFFARPGKTLGLNDRDVVSQANFFDPKFPTDAQYVENVMWGDGKVVFFTVNLPGSNNDTLSWTNGFTNKPAQDQEVANRTAADIRWMQAAFEQAMKRGAKAVVIGLQADMWDPAALLPGGDGLGAYTGFVQELAVQSLKFGKPVLLFNGDSHVFGVDKPLADSGSPTGVIHHAPAVPNLTRIVVQGSTTAPGEWLKLTIDTRKPSPFSWVNVPYCIDPLTKCTP
jgi:hypothetical protein